MSDLITRLTSLSHSLIIHFLGWHHYRVRFIYQSNTGRVIFSATRTIAVRNLKFIDDHKQIKKALGPLYKWKEINKRHLNNSKLLVEPQCYLGRWRHDRND